MWRLLEVGEKRERGDEIFSMSSGDGWFECSNLAIGSTVRKDHAPCRRRVPELGADFSAGANRPEKLVNPGNGYRLIDKQKDKPEPGDEYYNYVNGTWNTRCLGTRDVSPFTKGDTYRRKVAEPALPLGMALEKADQWHVSNIRVEFPPVVNPGNRVTVKSGTWSGCTGRVTHLFGWHEGNAIELDNVFVGGNRLTIMETLDNVTVIVEPVAVDPDWRLLELGETIQKGDEWITAVETRWHECRTSVGETVESHRRNVWCKTFQARRRVRIESPGWRWVDAGETLLATDEPSYWSLPQFRGQCGDDYWCIGSPATGDKYYRRKTAPFAG